MAWCGSSCPVAPPCYECTLGETDWALARKPHVLQLAALEPIVEGKVPTTPTISSIIAGRAGAGGGEADSRAADAGRARASSLKA